MLQETGKGTTLTKIGIRVQEILCYCQVPGWNCLKPGFACTEKVGEGGGEGADGKRDCQQQWIISRAEIPVPVTQAGHLAFTYKHCCCSSTTIYSKKEM